jgi:hypothetical protein
MPTQRAPSHPANVSSTGSTETFSTQFAWTFARLRYSDFIATCGHAPMIETLGAAADLECAQLPRTPIVFQRLHENLLVKPMDFLNLFAGNTGVYPSRRIGTTAVSNRDDCTINRTLLVIG